MVRQIILIALIAGALAGCGKNRRADLAVRRGDFPKAARLLREHVAGRPHDTNALRHLAAIECYKLGEYGPCAEHADSLFKLMPTDTAAISLAVFAHTMLANEATARNDTAAARREVDRIFHTYTSAGFWNYLNENYRVAERLLRAIIRLKPDEADAYLRLGILHWNRHRTDSSVACFRRVQELKPDNEDALVNELIVLHKANRIPEALDAADRLDALRKRLYPDSSFSDKPDTTLPPLSLDYRGAGGDQHAPIVSF